MKKFICILVVSFILFISINKVNAKDQFVEVKENGIIQYYECPFEPVKYCFAAKGKDGKLAIWPLGGLRKITIADKNKQLYVCNDFIKDDSNDYCVNGIMATKEQYESALAAETKITSETSGTNVIEKNCNAFKNATEKETCLACYTDCPACSYSSLGCIETTQTGIVIRVFQIGLGVVGGLALVQFIRAALLRQTADPTKIQESYDIITSIIIGIVLLLGSVVILRFIGIDILQLLPVNFLK